MADVWTDEDMIGLFSSMFEIQATPTDLREMNSDFVLKIYSNIVRDLGASLENIQQVPFNVSDDMQRYPEMYHSIVRTVLLAKVIGMLIQQFSNDNSFVLGDLIRPKPKRTRKFFEILLSAYISSFDCQDKLAQVEKEVELKLEAKRNLEDSVIKKKQELQELKKEHAANQIQEQQEIIAIKEIRGELDELQANKVNIREEADRIKAAISSLSTQINDVKLEILNKNEYLEKLNRQVVQKDEQQEVEQREHHLNERRKNYNERYNHLSNLLKVQKNLQYCIDTVAPQIKTELQDVQQEIAKNEESCAAITDMDRQKRMVQEESDDQKNVIMQVSEMVSSFQEMMKQLQHSWGMKEEALKQENEQLKVVKSELMRNLTEDGIVMQDLDSQICQSFKNTEKITEQRKEFEKGVSHYYEILMDATDKNNYELKKSIEELTQKVMALDTN